MVADRDDFTGPASIEWLSLIGQWFNDFATIPLGFLPFSSVLPLTGFTVLHSLRIAHLYHSVLGSQGIRVGRQTGDVSFLQAGLVCTTLVMSGTTMASILKGKPSSLLAEGSGELVTAYMLSGVGMKWLHPFVQQLPQLPLQLMCFLIDGFATTFGTLSLGLIPTLNDPSMLSSTGEPLVLPMLLLPLLCGSGASLLVPLFGLFQPRFSFGHPGFLSEKLSVDFWGPWLISLVYGTIVDGRGLFESTRQIWLRGILWTTDSSKSSLGPWMRPDEAHVLCSLLLSSLYVVNEFGPRILEQFTSVPPNRKIKATGSLDNHTESSAKASSLQTSSGQITKRTSKKIQ